MRRHAILFFALLSVVAGVAHGAFTIDPAMVTLDASAGEKTAFVEVMNTGGAPVAVSLEFLERELDLDGNLDNKAMVPCKDFLIYPSEVIIRPNERVKVQFTYRGKRKIKEDRAYFLFSKEVALPLEDEEDEGVRTNIQVLMNYYTIVVFQTGKEGKLEFVSSKAIDGGNIELIVENRGGGRVSTRNLAIKTGSDIIKNFTGTKNSIMPGQRRRFTFKYLRPLTSKEVKFIYDYSASN